ncbi:hypothetical protein [Streptomyces filamentosus]
MRSTTRLLALTFVAVALAFGAAAPASANVHITTADTSHDDLRADR